MSLPLHSLPNKTSAAAAEANKRRIKQVEEAFDSADFGHLAAFTAEVWLL